jgi:hypothetical protein
MIKQIVAPQQVERCEGPHRLTMNSRASSLAARLPFQQSRSCIHHRCIHHRPPHHNGMSALPDSDRCVPRAWRWQKSATLRRLLVEANALTAKCQSFLDNVIAGLGQIEAWNDPRGVPRTCEGGWTVGHQIGAHLLRFIAGGIVRCMPLSRTQQPTADLFWAAGAQEPCRTPADLPSAQQSVAVVSAADKSSPRHVLPRDLSNALPQLDDVELDRLFAATRHELQRRGRLPANAPAIQPITNVGAAMEKSSERQRPDAPTVALTQGQVNAVRATFKAGITPSRIARQFGISQSDVRKVLASESRGSGRGR